MDYLKSQTYPTTPNNWWDDPTLAREPGCIITGALPPAGQRIWCTRSDGVRHGPATEWTENDRVDTYYRDDLKDGWEVRWTSEGRLLSAHHYVLGRLNGAARNEHPRSSEEGNYLDGKRHGRWSISRPDGSPVWVAEYRNGLRDGEWQRWHPNGQLAEQGRFHRDLREGLWTWWHENGTKAREAMFSMDIPVGWHHAWDATGTLLDSAEIRDGTGRWFVYHHDGGKKIEGQYRDGKRHGVWSQWDPAGRLLGTFALDLGTGVEIEWDNSGIKRTETEYRSDRRHGCETHWDDQGRLESVEQYDDGTLVRSSDYDHGQLAQVTEWVDGEIARLTNYDNGVRSQIWEHLPGGERVVSLENGETKEVRVDIGILTERATRDGLLTDPRPGSAYGNSEMHRFGNMSVSFEHIDNQLVRAIFQVGETGGGCRRLHLTPRRAKEAESSTAPANNGRDAIHSAVDLQSEFDIAEVYERMSDGSAVSVKLQGGKVTRIIEWQHGRITRDAVLEVPQWLNLVNLRGLVDHLRASGAHIDVDEYDGDEPQD